MKMVSFSGTKNAGYNRMKFLIESLADVDRKVKESGGSGLWLFFGKPSEIFRKLHEKLGINKLCFEQDCEPIWRNRDEDVEKMCLELGISVAEKVSHTLWDPLDIIKANGGFAPLTYVKNLNK